MSPPPPSGASGGSGRTPSRRRQQAAATQEQLLSAARAVFEEKGYQATSVGAITERAATAHGTFYLYFRNKEDVFAKVMADVIDEMYVAARPRDEDGQADGVRLAIASFLDVFAAHRGLWRCLLEGMLASPSIEAMWLDLRRRFVERTAAGLAREQAAGRVRPFDPVMAAHALGAMTEWFAFTHLVLDEPPATDGGTDAAAGLLADLWVHAVRGRVDPPGS